VGVCVSFYTCDAVYILLKHASLWSAVFYNFSMSVRAFLVLPLVRLLFLSHKATNISGITSGPGFHCDDIQDRRLTDMEHNWFLMCVCAGGDAEGFWLPERSGPVRRSPCSHNWLGDIPDFTDHLFTRPPPSDPPQTATRPGSLMFKAGKSKNWIKQKKTKKKKKQNKLSTGWITLREFSDFRDFCFHFREN
jgi:hypothetical protein